MEQNIYFSIPTATLPVLNKANIVTIDFPYVHFRRTPSEYILYVIIDGVMYLTEDDVEYTLRPGDLILLDPKRCHFGREASRCTYYYFHFLCNGIKERNLSEKAYREILSEQASNSFSEEDDDYLEELILPKYYHVIAKDMTQIETLAKAAMLAYHEPFSLQHTLASCHLTPLFINWMRIITDYTLADSSPQSDHITLQVVAWLKIYYYMRLSSEDIARHFHGNFDYINRKFKKTMGQTIFQWLNEYRIQMAKDLLHSGFYNNSQIAEKTGFSNEYYFSRVFKKITGVTPSAYAKAATKLDNHKTQK